jgi:peptide-methionine (R)-S-oxide reductase
MNKGKDFYKQKSTAWWRQELGEERYRVLRQKGTEVPHSGELVQENRTGDYACGACGQIIFKSDTKFESSMPGLVGWPAFSEVAANDAVELVDDNSLGMRRTEITCANCGSHLGHLFKDDPASPNGMHYCVNSLSLNFKPKE